MRGTGVQQTLQLPDAAVNLPLSNGCDAATMVTHCGKCGFDCDSLLSRAPEGREGLSAVTQQHRSSKLQQEMCSTSAAAALQEERFPDFPKELRLPK